MERNTRDTSRDRVNESYLRQMLRDDARYSQRERMGRGCGGNSGSRASSCGSGSCAYIPTLSGGGNAPAEKGRPLAMVYAEKQSFRELYDIKEALKRGTLFKELDFPLGV